MTLSNLPMNFLKSPALFLRRAWGCLAAAVVSLSSVDAQCGGSCGTPGSQTLTFSGSAPVKNGSITVTMYNPETGNDVTVTDSESGEATAQTPEGAIPIKPGDPYTGTVTVVSEPLTGSGCGTQATVVLEPGSTCGYTVECCKVTGGVDGPWSETLTLTFPLVTAGGTSTGNFKVRITKEADEDEDKEEEDDGDDSQTEEDGSTTQTSPPSIPENQQDVPPTVAGGPPAQTTQAGFSHTVDLGATPQTAGMNAGSLILAAPITDGAANPALLTVTNSFGLAAPEFEVIRNSATPPVIQQVKTDAYLADVQSITDGFKIRIFEAGDFVVPKGVSPLYVITVGAEPVHEYTYVKIPAASGHQGGISITTLTAGGTSRTREYLSTSGTGNAWRIVGLGGLQVTDYVSNFYYDENYDGTKDRWIRTDQETVSRGGIAYSETERDYHYQVLRQGGAVVQSRQFLLEERRSVSSTDPDLVTTYEPHPDFIGQAKSVIRSDGSWEVYDYYNASSGWRGRTKTVLRPWNGLPVLPSDADASTPTQNCEVSTYTYTSGSNGGLVVDEEITTLPAVGTVKKETTAALPWVPTAATSATGEVADLLLLAGIDSDWIPATANLHETSRLRWASSTESLKSTRLSYVQGTGPKRPWQGRSAGSFDSELRGTLTGYELGTYDGETFVPNTTTNAGTGTDVRSIAFEVQGEVDGTPSLAFLDLGESTKTEVIEDEDGRVLREELFIRTGASSWSPATATTYEYGFWPNGSVQEVIRKHDGRIVSRTLEVSRYETHSWDEQGIETREVRDALGRTVSITVVGQGSQPNVVTSFTYSGRAVTRTVTGGALSLTTSTTSDWTGRISSQTDETGAVTLTTYPNNGRSIVLRRPGNVTRGTNKNLDGQTIAIAGTGVVVRRWTFEALAGGNLQTTARTGPSTTSPRYVKTVTDWAGRTISQITPDPAGGADIVTTTTYAPGTDRVISVSSSAANVATVYTHRYSPTSDLTYQGYDLDSDGYLTTTIDRLTETKRSYELTGGYWWEVSTQKQYDVSSSAITTLAHRRLDGSAEGLASVVSQTYPGGGGTTSSVAFDRTAKRRTETISRSSSDLAAVSIDENGLKISETSNVSEHPTTYGYDALGRQISVRTPTGAITRTAYKTNGQVDTVTDPFGKVTSYAYHPTTHLAAGRVSLVTKPDGKTSTYAYSARGEVTTIAGTAEYRQDFTYSIYGEKATLTTWRDSSATDITTWNYQAGTGLLLEKVYRDSSKKTYTYHSSGKLATRKWARNVTATYSYNAYGDLTGIDYSDATPDVTISSHDRLGRPLVITQGGLGSEILDYHQGTGSLSGRSFHSDHALLPGIGVYYPPQQPDGSPWGFSETQAIHPHTTNLAGLYYEYDSRGRLGIVHDYLSGIHKYSYNPLISQAESVAWQDDSGIVHFRHRRTHDVAGRLLAIHSDAVSGGTAIPVTRYGYELDNVGRRTKATMIDGSNWNYGYNDRSEVTSTVRKNAAGTTIPVLGATYQYDGIGNRTSSTSDVLGTRTYTPNGLNQYANITTTTTRTVTGRAPAADPVSVNGTALTAGNRIGDIFHFTLPSVANSSSPVWQPATIVSLGTTIDRAFYHPKADTTPMYDLDGNLENDGRWVYSWDAENRLVQMESTTQAVTAGAPYRKLVFGYDAGGRRLSKTVYHGTASTPVFFSSTRWVYDGWNPVSEFTATAETGGTFTRTKSYTWGLDLSGTFQEAGCVGGLLAVTIHNGFSRTNYCPSYDGNGNIVAWNLEGQTVPVSRREYDAFGNIMVEQGAAPSEYGFSTKVQDPETGLCYYGYRYYDSLTGKWLSKDPMEEKGGVNLNGFLANDAINSVDVFGEWGWTESYRMGRIRYKNYYRDRGTSIATSVYPSGKAGKIVASGKFDVRKVMNGARMTPGEVGLSVYDASTWKLTMPFLCKCVEDPVTKEPVSRLEFSYEEIENEEKNPPSTGGGVSIPTKLGVSISWAGTYSIYLGIRAGVQATSSGGISFDGAFRSNWVREESASAYINWMAASWQLPIDMGWFSGRQLLVDQWTKWFNVKCELGEGNKPIMTMSGDYNEMK